MSNTCKDHIIQTRLNPFCFILTGLLGVENERYERRERETAREGEERERGRRMSVIGKLFLLCSSSSQDRGLETRPRNIRSKVRETLKSWESRRERVGGRQGKERREGRKKRGRGGRGNGGGWSMRPSYWYSHVPSGVKGFGGLRSEYWILDQHNFTG